MFIDNYTGDVFISGVPKTPGTTVSLFGVTGGAGRARRTPVLPDFDAIEARLRADPRVRGVAGQVTGMGLVAVEGRTSRKMSFLFGVDPATYPGLFPDTKLVEGRYLAAGRGRPRGLAGVAHERGEGAEDAREGSGDRLLVNGFGRAGFKIREVTIVGVVDFGAETEGMDMMAWANANTVRILSGVDVSAEDVVLSSGADRAPRRGERGGHLRRAPRARSTQPSARTTARPRRRTSAAARQAAGPGGRRRRLVALPPRAAGGSRGRPARSSPRPTRGSPSQGIAARAGDWKAAAGPFSQSIDVVRIVFNVADPHRRHRGDDHHHEHPGHLRHRAHRARSAPCAPWARRSRSSG